MATYAIGDIQGCFDELQQLLDKLNFDPAGDRLWFTGDLVNRGPKSLETLHFVKSLGENAVTVLGNHDLHLLALWRNKHHHFKANETLAPIFAAEDHDELLQWLRHRPLLHYDPAFDCTLIHAGLPPQWNSEDARRFAGEVEAILRGDTFEAFLGSMYGNQPSRWDDNLDGWDRARFIVNCFTRLRFCTADGRLEFKQKGGLDSAGAGCLPWFQVPGRKSRGERIIFGHWSTLGLHREDGVTAIDTGCLWGGKITALILEDNRVVQYDCPGACMPGTE